MKKLLVILGLFTYTSLGFAQGDGILKDTRKYALIFLSQTQTVRNKDYPASLKEKIIEFKNSLNKDSAEQILRTSLLLEDKSSSLFVGASYINNGLGMNLRIIANTQTKITSNGQFTTTTTSHGYGSLPILIQYSDIENVYIRKIREKFTVEFWIKIYRSLPPSKRPYHGQNFFYFTIRPETDEVALIASLLFLCNNIKIKD